MLLHWIWLSTRQGLSQRTKYELVRQYTDPEAVYLEQGRSYREVKGVTPKGLAALKDKSLEEAKRILSRCRQLNVHLLTLQDAAYPQRLKGIYDPPILLYCWGTLPDWEDRPLIGAVGTRHCSDAGIQAGHQLGYQIVRCGGGIVSGIAEGIDAAVLTGALSAGGQVTVFLAGGVDVIYPKENAALYEQVRSRGCLISEYPPGTQHLGWHFPVRNRMISGISNSVLVVEAPEKSGALITARHALEQGRDVYAVPCGFNIPSGKGSNALLKDGAAMAECGWDILEQYQAMYPGRVVHREEGPDLSEMSGIPRKSWEDRPQKEKKSPRTVVSEKKVIDNGPKPPYIDVEKKPLAGTPEEQSIVDQLRSGPQLTDTVISRCGLAHAKALAAMTMLEIRGIVKRLPGNLLALNDT